ncbi:MAG: MBL fold metallo-hydrolase [Candidatus Hermodarchaeia archaeon]|jgi:Cft2 family RNA processing exonuclease
MKAQISWVNGITIKLKKDLLCFDPSKKNKDKSPFFISHAHSDHLGGLRSIGKCHLTKGTLDILSQKIERKIENVRQIKYGNSVKINDVEVIAHNAGHILGSAQFEIKGPESTITYTGDINYRQMETTDAAVSLSSDILIIESTFGSPEYVFPRLEDTSTRLYTWAIDVIDRKKVPVFKVYSAGKAQEVIKILNIFTKLPIVTHPTITKICNAYVENDINLTYVDSTKEEGKELLQSRECAFITPTYNKISDLQKYSLAVATGWAVKYPMKKVNAAFPLSSHADFNQLVAYVKASKPKQVYTIFGFTEIFANYLSKKFGIKARPLLPNNQRTLSDFY